ncbi:hypothetical protein M8J77_024687 [Diaphorina citri]|nr:hypothetical protein M8J77_024687 [Diaphorina citri]
MYSFLRKINEQFNSILSCSFSSWQLSIYSFHFRQNKYGGDVNTWHTGKVNKEKQFENEKEKKEKKKKEEEEEEEEEEVKEGGGREKKKKETKKKKTKRRKKRIKEKI